MNDFLYSNGSTASWKYNQTKKSNGEEFSFAGLVISLSIAFFIVAGSSFVLNLIYRSL